MKNQLSQSFEEKPNKVIEKWKNVNANMTKRLQSFNETLTVRRDFEYIKKKKRMAKLH